MSLALCRKSRIRAPRHNLRVLPMCAFTLWRLPTSITPIAEALGRATRSGGRSHFNQLKVYADAIAVWQECQECQEVVSSSVTFINEQGLFRGAASQLQSVIGDEFQHAPSQTLARRLIDFVAESEVLSATMSGSQ